MEKNTYLNGIALANFRGIGKDLQRIGPFSQFNYFIGPNNAGKSCVLAFISQYLDRFGGSNRTRKSGISELDIHLGATQTQVELRCGLANLTISSAMRDKVRNSPGHLLKDLHDTIERFLAVIADDGLIWFRLSWDTNQIAVVHPPFKEIAAKIPVAAQKIPMLWSAMTGKGSGDMETSWIPDILAIISGCMDFPKTAIIPAIREISAKGREFKDWSGSGLIEELARHQNPLRQNYREDRAKFDNINAFLRSVTDNPEATIEIPHDREHVLVHLNDRVLPLSSLGTGIHEVVMLAAFCTMHEQQIVCIEEPEIHLHPVLQRRLAEYLQENTDNQYFIATHSACFIDTQDASVFHVRQDDGATVVEPALTTSSRFDLLQDLGYKASDLLHSNVIIWVEGPSDRVYLAHWIGILDPELREGVHYSIMFYGGRLLSHLRTSREIEEGAEQDVEALIEVRRVNQNLVIVIDSDRKSATDRINSTKQRIIDETTKNDGIAWVTAGREIENYVEKAVMDQALAAVYKSFASRAKTGQYDHVLPFKRSDGTKAEDVDKVRVAREACKRISTLSILDLEARIAEVVKYIKKANHMR